MTPGAAAVFNEVGAQLFASQVLDDLFLGLKDYTWLLLHSISVEAAIV